jgi:hypothetical protein
MPCAILIHFHCNEISDLACKISKSPKGSKKYLRAYPIAVEKVKKKLGKARLLRYKAKAKRWAEEKPSWSQQCRYVYFNHSIK